MNSTGAWIMLAWGQQYVGAGLAGVLNSTSPLFVFAFAWVAGQAYGGHQLLGCALGFAGVVLILGPNVLGGLGTENLAELACLFGAVLYAGAAIHGHAFGHINPAVTAAGTMIWASAVLVPAALIADRPWALAPSLPTLFTALALAVLSAGLALLLYVRLVRTLGSLGVASQSYLRAGVALVLGAVLLGEDLSCTAMAGLLAALAGAALIVGQPGRKVA
jgi:drug/metabolite transporter (DMT)-like permease